MSIRVFGPNNYQDRCFTCGGRVGPGEGRLGSVGNQRVVWCKTHLPSEQELNPRGAEAPGVYFDLSPEGDQVWVTLRGRHPREAFDNYVAAKTRNGLRGTKIKEVVPLPGGKQEERERWQDYCAITSAGRVWKALTEMGFTVTASPRAAAAMQGAAAQQQADDAAVNNRLSHPRAANLFPFQRVGVQWLSTRTGAILADEMGCGKTVQTLMAIGDKRPVLLVVPASLKLNWRNEAAKWRPEYEVTVLKGRGSFRYPKPGEIVIVNYDILPKALPKGEGRYGKLPALTGVFAEPPQRLVLVADEAHALKNSKTQRTENFRFLGDVARSVSGQVWLLTGTPLLNRPPELWGVFASGGFQYEAFGDFDQFKAMFNARQGHYGIEWGNPTPMVAECIRRVQLRREKKDVLRDLPSKMRKHVPIAVEEVSAKDRKLFDSTLEKLEEHERRATSKRAITKDEASAVAAFPMFTEFSTALTALAYAKTEPTIDYIKGFIAGNPEDGFGLETTPFLVFSAHVEPLKMVKAAVEKYKIKCGIITGEVSSEERAQIVADFQEGRLDCVCISIKAGGVGLTLTRAAHSVFIDLEVVPALNVQAEDRIHRIGQTMPVMIHQIVLDHPLDRHVNELVLKKMELFESTVGASTFLPTDTVAPNAAASAMVQAAANIAVAAPTPGRADAKPAAQVRRVQYESTRGTRTVVVPQAARPAQSPQEVWAANAIASLTGMDSDRASEENGMGWNMADTSTGHQFNALIQGGFGLTDSQWVEAVSMLGKYHGQVGRAPAAAPGQKRVRRETSPQPAQVGPPAAPDVPAPVPVAARGIGEVGRGAHGEVVCAMLPTARAGTVTPAIFQTADGRAVVARGGVKVPAGIKLLKGATYRVRFEVLAHKPAVGGGVMTEAGEVQIISQTRPPPASVPAPVQGIAGYPFAGMSRHHLWDRR